MTDELDRRKIFVDMKLVSTARGRIRDRFRQSVMLQRQDPERREDRVTLMWQQILRATSYPFDHANKRLTCVNHVVSKQRKHRWIAV
jgi:hypothetical protein